VAAALRGLQLPDTDCERLVFRIRAHNDHAILAATDDDLDELIGFVAAEANSDPTGVASNDSTPHSTCSRPRPVSVDIARPPPRQEYTGCCEFAGGILDG
jgi:hypothetical protein